MDVLVVLGCSGSKRFDPVIDADEIDRYSVEELTDQYPEQTAPAVEQYTGNEHQHVRTAVDRLKKIADVRWIIISAGFGVLESDTEIPSYVCTFSDIESVRKRAMRMGYNTDTMTNSQTIQSVGEEIGITRDLVQIFAEGYDLIFIVLGESYLIASESALNSIPDGVRAFAFAAEGNRDLIGGCRWIPATEEERAHFATVWTELRGRLFREFVDNIGSSSDLREADTDSIYDFCLHQD